MTRATILLFFVVAIAYVAAFPDETQGSQECGPNEVFNSCGSPCVDTCERKASPICTMRCEIGCQCKPGYVRNRENKCVLTREC
ncbi:chymotrypsin inhibitor-like [Nomia melanderi]|uniref:chymotrypsin inhibitor-like n=1 Tax=Nomia melanderi TaxID=2448451 RepID=UPI0013041A2A|nr:chymotrypsin inhibitor-like [Nomia melanderi]